VTIFGGWANDSRTRYIAYEQTRPRTRIKSTPFAYWSHADEYVPYRYKYVKGEETGRPPAEPDGYPDGYPGDDSFGPGADDAYVAELGRMLGKRGASTYYRLGPGPRWSQADREATKAFQRAQGWRGAEANGIPGPDTWRYLVRGRGQDLGDPQTSSHRRTRSALPYPGHARFRPGRSNDAVLKLGSQLVAKGFGKYYRLGPSRDWDESDRRAVEAFQRAQGWSGSDADGYPGPETWRRLFA
jgi:murein L,D-transpeptidase YcbB/YkuD